MDVEQRAILGVVSDTSRTEIEPSRSAHHSPSAPRSVVSPRGEGVSPPEVFLCDPTLPIHALLNTGGGDASSARTTDFLWALVRFFEPAVIVEAGTFQGHGALSCAFALRTAHLSGHIWTCDIAPSPVMAHAHTLGLADYITFVQGDLTDLLPQVPHPIDLAYLDAGPDTTGLRWRHFQALQGHMADFGVIATDDVDGDWGGVEHFREQFYLRKNRGLALWQHRVRSSLPKTD